MKELETRIVDIDVEDIRSKLLALGGVKVKSEDQVNEIYDFSDGRLLQAKGYARIRTITDRLTNKETIFMTTKKMLSQDTFKVMEENETIVMDAEMSRRIFLSLGLELKESIKKYRESYKLENSLVEIDINDKYGFNNDEKHICNENTIIDITNKAKQSININIEKILKGECLEL